MAAALSEVEVNTTVLDFGTVVDGKVLSVTVTNKFLRKVNLTFTLLPPTPNQPIQPFSLIAQPVTVESLKSTIVRVKAAPPSSVGQKTVTLKIGGTVNTLTGDRPLESSEGKTVTLRANVKELFEFDPLSFTLDFGSVAAGQELVKTLTLKANADLIITTFKVDPPFAADNVAGQTINAGSQKVIHILLPASAPVGSLQSPLKVLANIKSPFDPAHPFQQVRNLTVTASVSGNSTTKPDLSPTLVAPPTVLPPTPEQTKSTVSFQLKVTNSGGASVACAADVLLDGVSEKTINVPAISSGGNNVQDVSFKTNKNGQHTLKIQVDSNNGNNESNENNNVVDSIIIQIP
jgi:hypothetical protein